MLTLVAAVLVDDLAYDPGVDLIGGLKARDAPSFALSLKAMSETSQEKDMINMSRQKCANGDSDAIQSHNRVLC